MKKISNFLQVGPTTECSNCHPGRYIDCKALQVKCKCICHSTQWKLEFDYNFGHVHWGSGEDEVDMTDSIKDFIEKLLAQRDKALRDILNQRGLGKNYEQVV